MKSSDLVQEEITKAALKQIDMPALIKKIKPRLEKELANALISRIHDNNFQVLYDVLESKPVRDVLIKRFVRAFK